MDLCEQGFYLWGGMRLRQLVLETMVQQVPGEEDMEGEGREEAEGWQQATITWCQPGQKQGVQGREEQRVQHPTATIGGQRPGGEGQDDHDGDQHEEGSPREPQQGVWTSQVDSGGTRRLGGPEAYLTAKGGEDEHGVEQDCCTHGEIQQAQEGVEGDSGTVQHCAGGVEDGAGASGLVADRAECSKKRWKNANSSSTDARLGVIGHDRIRLRAVSEVPVIHGNAEGDACCGKSRKRSSSTSTFTGILFIWYTWWTWCWCSPSFMGYPIVHGDGHLHGSRHSGGLERRDRRGVPESTARITASVSGESAGEQQRTFRCCRRTEEDEHDRDPRRGWHGTEGCSTVWWPICFFEENTSPQEGQAGHEEDRWEQYSGLLKALPEDCLDDGPVFSGSVSFWPTVYRATYVDVYSVPWPELCDAFADDGVVSGPLETEADAEQDVQETDACEQYGLFRFRSAGKTSVPVLDATVYAIDRTKGPLYTEYLALLQWSWERPEDKKRQIHHEAIRALATTPREATMRASYGPPDGCIIYVDGSAGEDSAAWGMVVLHTRFIEADDQMVQCVSFAGYTGGKVPADACERCPGKLPLLAEMVGMMNAIKYMHNVKAHCKDGQILCDNMLAVRIAQGNFKIEDFDGDLQISMCAGEIAELAWSARMKRSIEIGHVSGHNGNAWNEAADAISRAARLSCWFHDETHKFPSLYSDIYEGRSASGTFAFLKDASEAAVSQYPVIRNDDGELQIQVTMPDVAAPVEKVAAKYEGEMAAIPKRLLKKKMTVGLKCGSVNFLSLRDKNGKKGELGLNETGRIACIQEQMHENGYNIVGGQETRMTRFSEINHKNYMGVYSAAEKGALGCCLWIAKDIQLPGRDDDKGLSINRKAITVLLAQPRRLLISINCPGIHINACVLHAPTLPQSEAGNEEYRRWWDETAMLVAQHFEDEEILVMADTNAQLHSSDDWHIGDRIAHKPSPRDEAVAEFLQQRRLFAPSTFSQFHSGDDYTWQSPATGEEFRIDYVFASISWWEACIESKVDLETDVAMSRVDHKAVYATFELVPVHLGEHVRRRRAICSAVQLKDAEVQQKLKKEVGAIQKIPWQIEPTTHVAILQEHVQHAIQKVVPPKLQKTVPEWMEPDTKAAIMQKRQWFKLRCNALIAMRRGHVSLPFLAWKHMCQVSDTLKDALTNDSMRSAFDYNIANKHIKLLSRIVRRKTQRDKRKKADEMCTSIGNDLDAAQMKSAFKTLKTLRPYKPRPPIMKKNSEGKMASTYEEAQGMTQEELAEKFKATVSTFEEAIEKQRAGVSERWNIFDDGEYINDVHSNTDLNWSIIPTIQDVSCKFAKMPTGKAHGEDGVIGEVYKICHVELAEAYHPVYCKSALTMCEPMQFRGANNVQIPKSGTAKDGIPAMRNISCADIPAKTYHSLLRKPLVKATEGTLRDGTFNIGGRGTDMGHHTVRAFANHAKQRSWSFILIFIDLIAAFDNVTRSKIFGTFKMMQQGAKIESIFGHAGVDRHTTAIFAEAFDYTWLSQDGLRTMLWTTIGSRQGDPLGDSLFIILFAAALNDTCRALEEAGLIMTVHYNADRPLLAGEDDEDDGARLPICDAS
eukprot:TRINITY_DN19527_c0_g1_i1.p1 TRINITY_DN19527_c0_g1~~TRINITY_DN19527_c0_g1_i1.p1  ORF type:complete len:1597 (+),score=273.28 TRINITY_DN19527_c0_g1_i1:336-5126(+)